MNEITKIMEFKGIPVRVVQVNEQPMIPLNDIADGITHDRSGLRKLYHRNERILNKWSGVAKLATAQGIQDHICLNHDGVTALLMKVDFARTKDPVKQQNIIDFQEIAAITLSKIIKGEPITNSNKTTQFEKIRETLRTAKDLAIETGRDLSECQIYALISIGETGWAKFLQETPAIRNMMPSVVHGIKDCFTITQIAEKCGTNPQNINLKLKELGFQYKEQSTNLWRLTTKTPKEYAEEFWFTSTHCHGELRIRWFLPIFKAAGFVEKPKEIKQKQIEAPKKERDINLSQKPEFPTDPNHVVRIREDVRK